MPAYYNLHETYRMKDLPGSDVAASYPDRPVYTVSLYRMATRTKYSTFQVQVIAHYRYHSRVIETVPFADLPTAKRHAGQVADHYGLDGYNDRSRFETDFI